MKASGIVYFPFSSNWGKVNQINPVHIHMPGKKNVCMGQSFPFWWYPDAAPLSASFLTVSFQKKGFLQASLQVLWLKPSRYREELKEHLKIPACKTVSPAGSLVFLPKQGYHFIAGCEGNKNLSEKSRQNKQKDKTIIGRSKVQTETGFF